MIAMESTSVYWKPLVNIFETECLEYMVVNAAEVKNRPVERRIYWMHNGYVSYFKMVC